MSLIRSEVHTSDMMKCPKHVPPKEWVYACERAARAKKYRKSLLIPFTILAPSEFEDPVWQWENEVRGRFGGVVGGNLK